MLKGKKVGEKISNILVFLIYFIKNIQSMYYDKMVQLFLMLLILFPVIYIRAISQPSCFLLFHITYL